MDGDLFIAADTECSDGVAGFACRDTKEITLDISKAWPVSEATCSIESRMRVWHTVDWSLTAQLLKHFGSTGQSIARFANGDIEDEFLDTELAHRVRVLVFAGVRLPMTLLLPHSSFQSISKELSTYHCC